MVNQNLAGPVFHQSHGMTFCTIETKTNRDARNSRFNLGVRTSVKGNIRRASFFFISCCDVILYLSLWRTEAHGCVLFPLLLLSRLSWCALFTATASCWFFCISFFGQNHYPRSARRFGRVGAVGAECVGLLQPFVSICCLPSEAYTCRPPISSAELERQHSRAKPLSVQVCIYIRSLLKSPPWEMDFLKFTALHL